MGNFFIEQKHRTLKPAVKLIKFVKEAGRNKYGLIYGFPKSNTEALFKHVGFRKLGDLKRYAKVLNTESSILE